ncbi:MAG: HAMP domain-containing histidine kinase [Lachnospiraceae bacterium]|nr:HAMP domain-containing histidine kinase [Lachnospiraceae bacterium]
MKKLTVRTFALLTALALTIFFIAFLCIWIALPYTDKSRSQRLLDAETEQLVSDLRVTEKQDSEPLFTDFIRETGAYLFLLDGEENAVSPFTFEPTNAVVSNNDGYPFRFADSDDDYILIVQYNSSRSDELTRAILNSVPYVAITAVILCLAGAWFFSKRTTQPIIRIGEIAGRMADLDFSWYCPDIRNDEIGMLSASINEMSDKLHAALDELNMHNRTLKGEIALEKEREHRRMLFFSGVSHELKTPIAVVIGQLEGMQAGIGVYKDREKYLARSAEILHSLSNFIKEVLSVSYLDISDVENNESVNLSETIKTLAEEYSDYAVERSITVVTEAEDDIIVGGDKKLLDKALGNIMGNAVTHTSDHGSVKITLTRENGAVLVVENSPAHIDEKHLPHLFEAFYRADPSSERGSGLGLYITRMIFEKYNIGCKIENTADGVSFTVCFDKTTD